MQLSSKGYHLHVGLVLLLGIVLWFGRGADLYPVHFDYRPASTLNMPVFYVKTEQRAVALTFDISWGEATPPLVLSVLEQMDQKATFFLSGPWTSRHPEIVKSIVDAGHEIASHGDKHVNMSQLSRSGVADNIRSAHDVLVLSTKTEPRFFRPPNGDYDDLVVEVASLMGYDTIIWSVDSLDWKNPGVSTMIKRVSSLVFPGAIMLFHASDSCKETHIALPEVLNTLKDMGYKVVTLGELWEMGEPGHDDPRGRPNPNR
jgi:polysaccharide deacetylase family sporulation protein PdaB